MMCCSVVVFGQHVRKPTLRVEGRTTMTGNWNGMRERMEEAGVTLSATYFNDLLGNPVGGKHRGFANAGSFGLDLSFDLEKIARFKGLTLFSSFVFRSGTNLSATKIDNQFPVAQLYGTETYILNELYLEEMLFHERVIVKAGRLDGGNDFLASPLYGQYVNNAFDGNPISIFFNVPFSAYPNATWGIYLDVQPHRSLLFKFAIYNANDQISKNKYHGGNFTFKSTQGAFLITEWAFLANQGPDSHGLPGNYKLGGYYVVGKAEKFDGSKQKGNYGYYILLDQMVYRRKHSPSNQGLTPFVAFMFAPINRNTFPFFFMAGLVYKGIITTRLEDVLAVGIAYGHYSEDLKRAEQLAKNRKIIGPFGNQPQVFETVLEANYWVQVNKWLSITPDVQYIINPKGFGTIQNALVLGVQIGLDL